METAFQRREKLGPSWGRRGALGRRRAGGGGGVQKVLGNDLVRRGMQEPVGVLLLV